jgi:hypothetical protein
VFRSAMVSETAAVLPTAIWFELVDSHIQHRRDQADEKAIKAVHRVLNGSVRNAERRRSSHQEPHTAHLRLRLGAAVSNLTLTPEVRAPSFLFVMEPLR